MRIAFITLEYPPHVMGGAGIYVSRTAFELARRNHEVHIFTVNTRPSYEYSIEKQIHIHRLPGNSRSPMITLFFWISLPNLFRRISKMFGGFDIVHGNGISDLTLSKIIAPQPRVVTVHHLALSHVQTIHPSLRHRLLRPGSEIGLIPYLEPIPFRRADNLIAVSDFTKSELIAKYGIDPRRISVILHGADPDEYRFSPEDIDQLRTKLRIDGNRMVLFVGRLEPRKGIDILLYAFAQVLEKVNSILVLVGSGSQASYKALAGQLGIEQHVFFMGYVDDNELRKLYAACDLFVLPSLLEGLGIVILEARAAGKYVVASRIGGIPEVVPVGAGILVPPGKVFPLANGIIQSLCKSHNRLPPVQTWSDVSEQLISFYKTSVGKSSV